LLKETTGAFEYAKKDSPITEAKCKLQIAHLHDAIQFYYMYMFAQITSK